MLATEDFWQLQLESIELPSEEHKIRTGFVKYDELGSLFENLDSESEDENEEMQLEIEEPQIASSIKDGKNEKQWKVDNRALYLYFVDKVKPKQISKVLRIGVNRVYRVVEQTKKALIKLTGVGQRRRSTKRRIKEDTKKNNRRVLKSK